MPKKILLIQLRQLGDIILTTPSLRELKKKWPKVPIDFLCHPMGKHILQDNPYLNSIITYDPKGSWMDQLKLLNRLRQAKYDLVLDFMYNPRSAFYSYSTGAAERLAFPSRRQFLFNRIVKPGDKTEYIVQEKFRYLRELGLSPDDCSLDIPWNESHTAPLKECFAQVPSFQSARIRVAISPTHRRAERQWPVERYAEIADRLVRTKRASVVWIWGPGEDTFVKNVIALCKQPMVLAPKTTFRELAAFLANCDLFLGNSNGPSHLAVANTPSSLQLHGNTYAAAWCPLTPLHRAIQGGENLPEGRGPIGLIQSADVWQTLETMWLEVERVAERRRSYGIRSNWMHKLI